MGWQCPERLISVLEGSAYLFIPAHIQSTFWLAAPKSRQLPLRMLPLVFLRREVQSPGLRELVGVLEQAPTNSRSVFLESF